MRLTEARETFDRRLTFPADREAVIDGVGDVRLEAPNGDDTTVGGVLERADATEFGSADELYDTVVAFVDDAFIGRKFYDDRGGQSAMGTEQQSF
ncbi:DUF5789 family protein [Halobaculum lipolyticum]|uniref:DUF2795 domain-containing protein n=1 Tax=Halobaculum lipolyticum TaxID=3032001 RepID=A0ABD5WA63_9EURY|nr:hypothetical protein [Halobaculum sp. DT31]